MTAKAHHNFNLVLCYFFREQTRQGWQVEVWMRCCTCTAPVADFDSARNMK